LTITTIGFLEILTILQIIEKRINGYYVSTTDK
jgi:hypothetical protein